MSASLRAIRLFKEWMNFCVSIGWSEAALPVLADLWWEHHDEETGELK